MAAAGGLPMSPALLAAAPHRLLFFVGAANVLLAMLCWTVWLADTQWQILGLPQPPVPAGWLHAIVMQYLVLPPFIFGFLLTVFPRWMSQPALARRHYVAVGLGLLGGQALTLAGVHGVASLLTAGALVTLAAWAVGLAFLSRLLWRDAGRTWHAVSCAVALGFGFVGVALYAGYLHFEEAWLMESAIKFGTFGLLLPVFVTVAHRMFPFFASTVVPVMRLASIAVAGRVLGAEPGPPLSRIEPSLWLAVVAGCRALRPDRLLAVAQLAARADAAVVARAVRGLCVAARRNGAVRIAERMVCGHRPHGARPCPGARAVHRLFRKPAGRDGDARHAGPFGTVARARARRRICVRRNPVRCRAAHRRGARAGAALQTLAAFGWLVAFTPWALARRGSILLRVPTARPASAMLAFYPQIKAVHVAAVL
jgi:hypothetical protein